MKTLTLCILILCLTSLCGADDLFYHGSFLWNDIRDLEYRDNLLYCAFYEGVGIIDLRRDYIKKKVYSSIDIEGIPQKLFLCDSRLVVLTEAGIVRIIDISNPDVMRVIGSFTPEREIWDIAIIDDYLYAAVEYDGIVRYDISDPDNIVFTDSSMYGIRVIDLEVEDSLLYALDDYNGILIYDQNDGQFADPISEILLPHQAVSFTLAGDTVYAGLRPNGYMVGSCADKTDPRYLETRPSLIRGDDIMALGNGRIVLANSITGFELQYPDSDSVIDQIFALANLKGTAEIFAFGGLTYVAYPQKNSGLVAYAIDDALIIDINRPDMVQANPGPITQLAFVNSRLHTIGTNNWYEIYSVNNPDAPIRSGALINPPYYPLGMCLKGDTVFVADSQTKLVFPAVDTGLGNPTLAPPFFAMSNVISRPYIVPGYFRNADLFYTIVSTYILGGSRGRSETIPNRITWSFGDDVSAALFGDSVLFIGYYGGGFEVRGISDELPGTIYYSGYVSGRARDIERKNDLLYIAAEDLLTVRINEDYSLAEVYTNSGTGTVYQTEIVDNRLYCAARNGIFIFDITFDNPVLLFSGGTEAHMLAVDGETIAASDGRSVKLYTLPALDADDYQPIALYEAPKLSGYPNPFNPTITLVFEHFAASGRDIAVDIHDILGRKIKTLHTGIGVSDRGVLIWDGTDEAGSRVASGMYLFRARSRDQQAVFKAVLLK